MARMPLATNVAPATNSVGRFARIAARSWRVAWCSTTSCRQLRSSVLQPVISTANGRAMSKSHRPMRVPHNDPSSGVGWLVFERLQAAHEERGHEEGGGENKQQLDGGGSPLRQALALYIAKYTTDASRPLAGCRRHRSVMSVIE